MNYWWNSGFPDTRHVSVPICVSLVAVSRLLRSPDEDDDDDGKSDDGEEEEE